MSRMGVRSIIWGGRFIFCVLFCVCLGCLLTGKYRESREWEEIRGSYMRDMRNIYYLHPTAKSNVISVVAAIRDGTLFKRPDRSSQLR
jgi:hypothetical protein